MGVFEKKCGIRKNIFESMYGGIITIRKGDVMKEIHLGDAFLGFIPNMTEKRKVVEHRKARSLERIINYAKFFRENEEKLQAVYSKKEHVVRLVFTRDYMESDKEVPLFEVRERSKHLETNQELKKTISEYYIKGHLVSLSEFEFGQYILKKFKGEEMSWEESLTTLLQAAQEENRQIEKRVAQKSERIQRENQKRRDAERMHRTLATRQFEEAVHQLEMRGIMANSEIFTTNSEQTKYIEQKNERESNLNQFKNYKEAIEAAYPDVMGEDGFLEPDFDGMDVLKYVDENKLSQIFRESNTLEEFKTNTKHVLEEEKIKSQKEWQEQQNQYWQEQFEEQEKMDEVYVNATVDGNIWNLKSEAKALHSKDLAQEAIELIKEYKNNPLDVMEYLDFMSKFPELSPRNLALLEKQWPGANMVATYKQWAGKTPDASKNMGKVLKVKPQDIEKVTRVATDKKTGKTKTRILDQLSVRQGEKSKISLIRGQEERYFEKERDGKMQVHWEKYWSQEEKLQVEAGEIKTQSYIKYVPYKVFEISQTNIKPESLPRLLPNRHVNFEAQPEVLKSMKTGLEIYARSIGVEIINTEPTDRQTRLGNAKGAATLDGKKIIMNHLNTPSENVTTLIHELAHSTLHKGGSANQMSAQYAQQEFEAEMVSYVVSRRYGVDTREKAIPYMAEWTENMKQFSGEEGTKALSQSLSRIQKASHAMTKRIDAQLDPVLKQMQKRMHQKAKQHGEPKPTLSHQQNSLHIGR